MTKKKNTIKREMSKIVRKKISPSYLDSLEIVDGEKGEVSILRAVALAQVKKGLEGDLRAAEFIEKLLCSDDEEAAADSFDVVVKVVGGNDGA